MTHQTSNTDLREQVLKAAKVSKASVTFSQKIYSNNTEGPIETTNQEIVEIGIDDLMQLIEAHEAAATQTARLNELSKVPTTKVDIYKLERAAEIKATTQNEGEKP